MSPTLRTKRLLLRPLRTGDADAITAGLGDWDVIRWLSGPPYPFRREDAVAFIGEALDAASSVWAITGRDEGLFGIIGCGTEFGYWLRRGAWRRGIASEAARAVLDWHFSHDGPALTAGVHPDNVRSRHLLEKCGFVPAGHDTTFFPSRRADVRRDLLRLDAAGWAALSGRVE